MDNDKQKHVMKIETRMALGMDTPQVHIEKRRAAIKAALQMATAGLAATASGLAGQVVKIAGEDDGGTPPWGEVIVGPVWEEKNPQLGLVLVEAAELIFWE
jgi:hypothetical protein